MVIAPEVSGAMITGQRLLIRQCHIQLNLCSRKFNIDLVLFLDLPNLIELELSHNFLTSVPVGALSQISNLKFLNLGSNRIKVKTINFVCRLALTRVQCHYT